MSRTLRFRRETLAEIGIADLAGAVGGQRTYDVACAVDLVRAVTSAIDLTAAECN